MIGGIAGIPPYFYFSLEFILYIYKGVEELTMICRGICFLIVTGINRPQADGLPQVLALYLSCSLILTLSLLARRIRVPAPSGTLS